MHRLGGTGDENNPYNSKHKKKISCSEARKNDSSNQVKISDFGYSSHHLDNYSGNKGYVDMRYVGL